MNFSRIAALFVPPVFTRLFGRRSREARQQTEFRAFYKDFLRQGDLCFDIGANLGNRTRCFRSLGCRVVAAEPQAWCLVRLEREFRNDEMVTIIPKAVGREPGSLTMRTSKEHVLSSLSNRFIETTRASGRFSDVSWDGNETVDVTTLDELVREFGVPKFLKMDVEGYEAEVLAGLSVPVAALSFEWAPELDEEARQCVRRIMEIGNYEFNVSWGESMRFSRPQWRDADSMLRLIEEMRGESLLFGDIYARLSNLG